MIYEPPTLADVAKPVTLGRCTPAENPTKECKLPSCENMFAPKPKQLYCSVECRQKAEYVRKVLKDDRA